MKTIKQPELIRDDVWYVDPGGIYLRVTIEDARQVITAEGLPWFEPFTDLRYVYELLLGDEHYVNGTWGFGANGSPKRNYLTGYVALALEDYNTAAQALEAALNSPSYAGVRQHHEESLALAKSHAAGTWPEKASDRICASRWFDHPQHFREGLWWLPRLLHQKLGRTLIWPTPKFKAQHPPPRSRTTALPAVWRMSFLGCAYRLCPLGGES